MVYQHITTSTSNDPNSGDLEKALRDFRRDWLIKLPKKDSGCRRCNHTILREFRNDFCCYHIGKIAFLDDLDNNGNAVETFGQREDAKNFRGQSHLKPYQLKWTCCGREPTNLYWDGYISEPRHDMILQKPEVQPRVIIEIEGEEDSSLGGA